MFGPKGLSEDKSGVPIEDIADAFPGCFKSATENEGFRVFEGGRVCECRPWPNDTFLSVPQELLARQVGALRKLGLKIDASIGDARWAAVKTIEGHPSDSEEDFQARRSAVLAYYDLASYNPEFEELCLRFRALEEIIRTERLHKEIALEHNVESAAPPSFQMPTERLSTNACAVDARYHNPICDFIYQPIGNVLNRNPWPRWIADILALRLRYDPVTQHYSRVCQSNDEARATADWIAKVFMALEHRNAMIRAFNMLSICPRLAWRSARLSEDQRREMNQVRCDVYIQEAAREAEDDVPSEEFFTGSF